MHSFAAERRSGFERSEGFRVSLEEDFAHWRKKRSDKSTTFADWEQKHRRPYERALFQSGDLWKTAEDLLGIPKTVTISPNLAPRTRFVFEIPGERLSALIKFYNLIDLATGGDTTLDHGNRFNPSVGGTQFEANLSAPLDHFLRREGIEFRAHQFAVSVRIPRLNHVAIDLFED